MSILNCPIILASTSPRRTDLMKQVGLEFVVRAPSADETPKRGETAKAMVARLAREKADSVVPLALREFGLGLIIASDTTVVAPNGKILGKPADRAGAVKMLGMLAGKTHVVLTGYCLLSVAREMEPQKIVRVVSSKVRMRKMSKSLIEQYVDLGESMDKAGAYAVQGIGASLIESITGSYTNVVGLPMAQLLLDLEDRFGVVPFRKP